MISLLWRTYALTVFAIFFSVADQPLGHYGVLPISPTLAAIIALLPFPLAATLREPFNNPLRYLIEPIRGNAPALLSFAAIASFSLLLSILPGAVWDEDGKWILLITYGFALTILALFVPGIAVVQRIIPMCIITALALLLWSLQEDLAVPGTYSLETARAAGFPGNANFAALVSVMLCAAGLDMYRRRALWIDLLILALSGVMVVGTMSRSGLINFLFLLGIYLYFRLLHGGFRAREVIRLTLGFSLLVSALITILPIFAGGLAGLQQQTRLERFLNNKRVDDGSAASRFEAVKDSLRRIDRAPLLGSGTGHSRSMPELPHNLYLQQWVNNGVPGLLSFIALLVVSYLTFTRRGCRNGQAFIIVTAVGAAFSHNILDQRPFLMLLGILLEGSRLRLGSGGVNLFSTGHKRLRSSKACQCPDMAQK